jgi:DNA polymerase-1
MSQLLLIDGSNLARRNFHGQTLTTFTGIRTGCIYGTVASLIMITGKYPEAKVYVVWDSPGGSAYRKAIYPAYKGCRGPVDPDYVEDRNNLEELLTAMGVAQINRVGTEADDIIGYLAHDHDDEVIIVSNDKDFYQLINLRINVWSPLTTEFVPVINGKVPIKESGKTIMLYPHQVPDYKALVGDKSDNIPGAIGFGIGAAITFFESNTSIEPLFEGKANLTQLRGASMSALLQALPFIKMFKEVATINDEEGKVVVYPRPPVRKDIVQALFELYEFKQFIAMGERVYTIGGK